MRPEYLDIYWTASINVIHRELQQMVMHKISANCAFIEGSPTHRRYIRRHGESRIHNHRRPIPQQTTKREGLDEEVIAHADGSTV